MQLQLHPNTACNFNEQAGKLVQKLAISSRHPLFRVSANETTQPIEASQE